VRLQARTYCALNLEVTVKQASPLIALMFLTLTVSSYLGMIRLADASDIIYLPAVQREGVAPPAMPAATPTATSTPPPLMTIPNGDFEAGPGVAWQEQSPQGGVIVYGRPPSLPGLTVEAWHAHLGGHHYLGETVNWQSRLMQSEFMTLPADTPIYLHLNYQIISEEQPNEFGICDRDVLNIWVNTPTNSILWQQAQICEQFNTSGWTPFVLDLTHFAGQSIALEFQMRTDFEKISHVLLDDLVLRADRSGRAAP
jgi:hypothetical protein